VASAAWVFLVRAAIDFGEAASGSAGWAMTIGAGIGATLCLLLVFVLLARLKDAVPVRQRGRPGGAHRRR
jgi:hypothetical protein